MKVGNAESAEPFGLAFSAISASLRFKNLIVTAMEVNIGAENSICLSYNFTMTQFRPSRFLAIVFCVLVQIVLLQPSIASACPTCKDGLHDGTALAYAISIVFMMAMPFAIMSFWIVMIIRLRAKAAKLAAEHQS